MKFPVFQSANALAPKGMPKGVPVTVTLGTAGTPTLVQLTEDEMSNQIEFIQSMWVDNSLNPELLVVACGAGFNQLLRIPRFWQGVVPIISITPFEANFSTQQANIQIPIILMNVPMPIGGWAAV